MISLIKSVRRQALMDILLPLHYSHQFTIKLYRLVVNDYELTTHASVYIAQSILLSSLDYIDNFIVVRNFIVTIQKNNTNFINAFVYIF